ncbi:MAG: ABC transporter [Firmicutes bacterium ML8_F2]|jgi:ABC-type Mn2+/Zn2+ transport system permease subunit|nr:MAG: ABC transporter [Firmicutes bacterium ML8_F2]
MSEMLNYDFMQRALIAAFLVGSLCSVISFFVVLKQLSFLGAGISHTALGGIAIGLVTGIDPVLTGSIFSVLTAMGVGYVSRAGKMSADTVIGIFYAAGMALGIALISAFEGYYPELFSLLFGNILSVSFRDLLLMGIVLLLALAFIVLFFKELLAICFDEEMAEAGGLPVGPLYMVLLAVIGLTVIVSIQLVGIVLVAALIVIPGAAALRISKNYRGMLALSLFFGLVGSIGGLVLSYFYPVPPGAAIVLILTLLFILTLVLNFSLEKKLQRRGSFE